MFLSGTQTLLLAVFSLEFLICVKSFLKKRLFTVLTCGLQAAFYSLCTEIKTLYLANSLSGCTFFYVLAVILLELELELELDNEMKLRTVPNTGF